MSLVKTKKIQIGDSATATDNFFLQQPGTPDGTMRLGSGSSEYIRFNSTSPYLEVWNGSSWEEISGGGGDYLPLTGGTLTGMLTAYNPATSGDPSIRPANSGGVYLDNWFNFRALSTVGTGNTWGVFDVNGYNKLSVPVGTAGGRVVIRDFAFKNQLEIHRSTNLSSYIVYTNTNGERGSAGFSDTQAFEIRNGSSTIVTYVDSSGNWYVPSQIIHDGDPDTYIQFHADNQFRIVTNNTEVFEANTTDRILMPSCRVSGTLRIPVK